MCAMCARIKMDLAYVCVYQRVATIENITTIFHTQFFHSTGD